MFKEELRKYNLPSLIHNHIRRMKIVMTGEERSKSFIEINSTCKGILNVNYRTHI